MNIVSELTFASRDALMEGDRLKRRVISVVIGEIENAQNRKDWKEGGEYKIIKKLIESNKEIIKLSKNPNEIDDLKYEIEVLKKFLPKELSLSELASQLTLISTDILASGSQGKGMGIAMKFIKEKGINADTKNVKTCVDRIFGK